LSEQIGRVIDECLQLLGGYGLMNEYLILRWTPMRACNQPTPAAARSWRSWFSRWFCGRC